MSTDLTRWNRAGLSRFDYIDGNAVIWLELLRAALGERFPSWTAVQDNAPPGESDVERLERLSSQYLGSERGDLLWEITRALARSGHLLTDYLDTYANEGYLRTATQWDNVRRLVEMIDYHPAPPASAATRVVLSAKEQATGEVAAGFQIKYTPPDGGAPIIFETLEPLDVDAALNVLRPAGWNRSELSLAGASGPVWLADENIEGLSGGQLALLVNAGSSPDAAVVEIASVNADTGAISLTTLSGQPAPSAWALADLTLHARPSQIHPVLSAEANAVRFDGNHGLIAGDVVAWRRSGAWHFNRVYATDNESISLEFDQPLPATSVDIYKAAVIARPASSAFQFAVANPAQQAAFLSNGQFAFLRGGIDYSAVTATDAPGTFYQITNNAIGKIFVAPETTAVNPAGTVVEVDEEAYELAGSPGELASGQWVAAETDEGGDLIALMIDRVVEQEDRFFLTLDEAIPGVTNLVRIFGGFRYHIEPSGADSNTSVLAGTELSMLDLDIAAGKPMPALAVAGRKLIIEQQTSDGYEQAVSATVTAVSGTSLAFAPALPAGKGYTRGNTVIRGNVALAGHGEGQPERVLGSGDATRVSQTFDFNNEAVSFVADSTMTAGVRADVAVSVAGRTWVQVSNLNSSAATDSHYTVRMTQDGFLTLGFGDGVHGRRLPTGTGNVRIAWRKGTGLDGNLEAGSLSKPVKPHRLLNKVRQPLSATGGADMQGAQSLRDNAPATLLTLERAVSISDFKYLATSQSSVWQANAFSETAGFSRDDRVEVVVVPSGGGALGDLQATLEAFLQQHALPGVAITVSAYEPIIVPLKITVRIDSDAFDPDVVTSAVAAALVSRFSLKSRELGQSLNLAEIYQAVEAVQGVENSDCSILSPDESAATEQVRRRTGAGGIIKGLRPNARQVIYVAADGLGVTVDWQELLL